jgi:acetolactate synthase-1/2/3 large subunit
MHGVRDELASGVVAPAARARRGAKSNCVLGGRRDRRRGLPLPRNSRRRRAGARPQVFHALRDVLPPDTVATIDSGAHRILMSQLWRCALPRTLLQSTAFCTMGVSLPLAMGYKTAAPETPVLAAMGDGGRRWCWASSRRCATCARPWSC